jgi:hypothetical protein
MSVGKQLVLVNVAMAIGIAISLFMVPGSTPFWRWATVAVAFLVVGNVTVLVRRPDPAPRRPFPRGIVIAVGVVLLLLDVLVNRLFMGSN